MGSPENQDAIISEEDLSVAGGYAVRHPVTDIKTDSRVKTMLYDLPDILVIRLVRTNYEMVKDTTPVFFQAKMPVLAVTGTAIYHLDGVCRHSNALDKNSGQGGH